MSWGNESRRSFRLKQAWALGFQRQDCAPQVVSCQKFRATLSTALMLPCATTPSHLSIPVAHSAMSSFSREPVMEFDSCIDSHFLERTWSELVFVAKFISSFLRMRLQLLCVSEIMAHLDVPDRGGVAVVQARLYILENGCRRPRSLVRFGILQVLGALSVSLLALGLYGGGNAGIGDFMPSMADCLAIPVDIGLASVAKATNKAFYEERQKRKLARLERKAKAAETKVQASKRVLEAQARKNARNAKTMRSYLTSGRNSLNRGPLQCTRRGVDNSVDVGVDTPGSSSTPFGDSNLEGSQLMDTEVLLSCPAVVVVSDEEVSLYDSEDEPDLSGDKILDFDDDVFIEPPCRSGKKHKTGKLKGVKAAGPSTASTLKNLKKNYDQQRKFHNDWSAKEPWSEGVVSEDDILHMVRCKPCTVIRGKPVQMAPKWDTISKHDQRKIHKKCMVLYASRGPASVVEQIQGCSTAELRRKRVQFATLFQMLSSGRPMTEFEARFDLYEFLNVPNMPRKHWGDGSEWIMAEHLYDFVKMKIRALVGSATFFALSADETTTCDNSSWIAIHAYVMLNWCRVPLLLTIQKMESDGATANNLTHVIMSTLNLGGGVLDADIASKLLCFGTDGVSAFQGIKTGVTRHIKEKFAPFSIGVHCCTHRLNLAAQSLSSFTVMHAVEEVLRTTHKYFAHSPKKASEFKALSQQLESKDLKLLKNVKTRWMSCLSPIRRLLAEYKGVIALMYADRNDKQWGQKARGNLAKLLDPYVLLGMLALLPMLEAVDTLIQWAQKRDAFICDFVGALGTCLTNLYTFYLNIDTAFKKDEFHAFNQVLQCSHEQILMKWDSNLNLPCETLMFVVGGESLYALHDGNIVTREGYAAMVATVQSDCKEAAAKLMGEMSSRFPDHGLMDALGIVYPQYLMQGDCAATFRKHLDIIKSFYGEPKWVGEGENKRFVPAVLDKYLLESEQPLFKIAMIANAHMAMELPPVNAQPDQLVNPLTKLWVTLDANSALGKNFGEYIKLAEIAMVHVLGSVEDERTFSALSFLKDRLRNRLDHHLAVVVGMHCQNVYTLTNFPYDDCFKQWVVAIERQRYALTA